MNFESLLQGRGEHFRVALQHNSEDGQTFASRLNFALGGNP
jgi:hypothetical protein